MSFFFQPPENQKSIDPDLIEPAKAIRTSQIICIAMLMGLLTFLGVTLVSQNPGRAPSMILSYLGAGGALLQIVLRFIVPDFVASKQVQTLATKTVSNIDGHLFAIFQTRMVIGVALLEGAGFFNLVAYMVERQWWTLAIVGSLMLLIAMMFPTLQQFESWADEKKQEMRNQF